MHMRTIAGSISSADTSARTIRRRSLALERVQEYVCGCAEEVHGLKVANLKRTSSAEQNELLQDAQIKATFPADGTALAIKDDLDGRMSLAFA